MAIWLQPIERTAWRLGVQFHAQPLLHIFMRDDLCAALTQRLIAAHVIEMPMRVEQDAYLVGIHVFHRLQHVLGPIRTSPISHHQPARCIYTATPPPPPHYPP